MSGIKSVAVLSDVSVGYGTPQVLNLAGSLAAHWGVGCFVLEPDQPERPPVDFKVPGVAIRRIYTATHPQTGSGRTEFNLAALEELNRMQPDVVVFASFLAAPTILKLSFSPRLTIFYALEHTNGRLDELRLFQLINKRIDLAIFCEENRAALDVPRLGLEQVPTVVLYNGCKFRVSPQAADDRNARFFYGGLVHPYYTFGDWFVGGALDAYPIDIYGIIDGYRHRQEVIASLQQRETKVGYHGYISSGPEFYEIMSRYAYSIVIWAPHEEATLYAAPNKFFDAIAAGVPPIVAPHPLCVKLVNRYDCGIVMRDWRLSALRHALRTGQKMLGTTRYRDLVAGCERANHDLSWRTQFRKLSGLLDRLTSTGTTSAEFAAL